MPVVVTVLGRLTEIFRELQATRLWRNFRVVLSANVLSQALLILVSPLLARLYSPADFGVLSVYTSLVTLAAAFVTLRFDWLVPNGGTDREGAALFAAGAVALVSMVAMIAVLLALPQLSTRIAQTQYAVLLDYIYLLPLGVLGFSGHQLFQSWYVRRANLYPVSRTKIMQSAGNAFGSVAFGFANMGALGVVLAHLGASWLGISVLVRHARDLLAEFWTLSGRFVLRIAWQWRYSALLSTFVSCVNTASSMAMFLLLALVYPVESVGLFAFTHKLVAAPLGIIAQALSQSFWAHAATLAREGDYRAMQADFLKLSKLLGALAAVMVAACFAVAPLFEVIFGREWAAMGTVLICMAPLIIGLVVVSPTNHLVVLNRQGLQLFADLLRLVLVSGAVWLAMVLDWDFPLAILGMSIGSLLGHAVLFFVQIAVHRQLVRKQETGA